MNKKIWLAILLLTTLPCFAKETYYKIEVIAFKHLTDKHLNAEDWQGDTMTSQLAQAKSLDPLIDQPQSLSEETSRLTVPIYQLLPEQQWTLQKEHQVLNRRDGYDVLTHVAWFQTFDSKKNMPIRLTGGEILSDLPQDTGLGSERVWELDGIIKASRSHTRYFTVEANLALSEKIQPDAQSSLYYYDAIPQERFQHFYLRQKQRLQSHELHYFDHPLFGLLVKITPYEAKPRESS